MYEPKMLNTCLCHRDNTCTCEDLAVTVNGQMRCSRCNTLREHCACGCTCAHRVTYIETTPPREEYELWAPHEGHDIIVRIRNKKSVWAEVDVHCMTCEEVILSEHCFNVKI